MRKRKQFPENIQSIKKIQIVFVIFACIWVYLWLKAGEHQIINGVKLSKTAATFNIAQEKIQGKRGTIFDRNNIPLATTLEVTSVSASPYQIKNAAAAAKLLSPILEISEATLTKKLQEKRQYIWLKRKINDTDAKKIRDLKLPGINAEIEYIRSYPNGSLAGQLLGFVNIDGKGMEGLESAYQSTLAGGKAHFTVQRDARGRRLYMDANGQPTNLNGKDIHLTIDSKIQAATEKALEKAVDKYEGKYGHALVLDAKTGDILAMANYPFFNPNIYNKTPAHLRRNRVALDIYEPGSTLKPILFAAALDANIIDEDTLINCEQGRWKLGKNYIRDDSIRGHDWLTATKVMHYSSNIGVAKIGLKLGAQAYHTHTLHTVGLCVTELWRNLNITYVHMFNIL